MSVYCYKCPECGHRMTAALAREDYWACPFHRSADEGGMTYMVRDYKAELTSFRRSSCRAVAK